MMTPTISNDCPIQPGPMTRTTLVALANALTDIQDIADKIAQNSFRLGEIKGMIDCCRNHYQTIVKTGLPDSVKQALPAVHDDEAWMALGTQWETGEFDDPHWHEVDALQHGAIQMARWHEDFDAIVEWDEPMMTQAREAFVQDITTEVSTRSLLMDAADQLDQAREADCESPQLKTTLVNALEELEGLCHSLLKG